MNPKCLDPSVNESDVWIMAKYKLSAKARQRCFDSKLISVEKASSTIVSCIFGKAAVQSPWKPWRKEGNRLIIQNVMDSFRRGWHFLGGTQNTLFTWVGTRCQVPHCGLYIMQTSSGSHNLRRPLKLYILSLYNYTLELCRVEAQNLLNGVFPMTQLCHIPVAVIDGCHCWYWYS